MQVSPLSYGEKRKKKLTQVKISTFTKSTKKPPDIRSKNKKNKKDPNYSLRIFTWRYVDELRIHS